MKIGISTASFINLKETEDALSCIKELGAQVCEAYLQTCYEYRPEFAKKYAPRAEGVQVFAVRVRSCNFEQQLFSPSRRVRGDGFYWLDQVMRSAQFFGAKNYVFRGLAQSAVEDFDDWGAYMREITGFCARYGVSVCLENSVDGIYNRPEVFRELKYRCPELKGAFDMRAARLSGYPYTMYLNDMCGAIALVRLSDVDKNGKACLPDKGIYDFAEIFARLKSAGFDGSVLIDTPNFTELSDCKTSLEFLTQKASSV